MICLRIGQSHRNDPALVDVGIRATHVADPKLQACAAATMSQCTIHPPSPTHLAMLRTATSTAVWERGPAGGEAALACGQAGRDRADACMLDWDCARRLAAAGAAAG